MVRREKRKEPEPPRLCLCSRTVSRAFVSLPSRAISEDPSKIQAALISDRGFCAASASRAMCRHSSPVISLAGRLGLAPKNESVKMKEREASPITSYRSEALKTSPPTSLFSHFAGLVLIAPHGLLRSIRPTTGAQYYHYARAPVKKSRKNVSATSLYQKKKLGEGRRNLKRKVQSAS